LKAVKWVAVGLLGFLLFTFIVLFSLAYTVNTTALNSGFIVAEMDRLDIAEVIREGRHDILDDNSSEAGNAIIDTAILLAPDIKQQAGVTVKEIYNYLLKKTQDIDLAVTLKQTLLSQQFVDSLIDKADVTALSKDYLKDWLIEELGPDFPYLDKYLNLALPKLEPVVRQQVKIIAPPVVNYVLGLSPRLYVTISLEPLKPALQKAVRESFLESPPSELAGYSQARLSKEFDALYPFFAEQLPQSLIIDNTTLDTDIRVDITDRMADAEKGLSDAREAIGYFKIGFYSLIALMVLLILGIGLIIRDLIMAARALGITFLVCGVVDLISFLVGSNIAAAAIREVDIYTSLRVWLEQLNGNLFHPLFVVTIGLLVVGTVLLVLSFVYRNYRTNQV
jgi:hypothetical protein